MPAGPRTPGHALHLDAVRTALVAWVIAGHALLGYSAVGGWAYDEVREVTYTPAAELLLIAVSLAIFFPLRVIVQLSATRTAPRGSRRAISS